MMHEHAIRNSVALSTNKKVMQIAGIKKDCS